VAPTTPTTRRALETTTTTVPAYSFDDSVPPPKLVNTGTDYVAILKSLEAYGNWIGAHHPDPVLANATVAQGTQLLSSYVHDISVLRSAGKREVENLTAPTSYTIVSATRDSFSARVTEHIAAHQIVDRSGSVVSEHQFSGPTTYIDLVVRSHGRWYLASVDARYSGRTR
jgi:hypothetical protein